MNRRRGTILTLAALGTLPALPIAGYSAAEARRHAQAVAELPVRRLGKTDRWITPLGLGGQASLQWTGAGIDPADIVVRAVEEGVTYLDTANAYGPSQANYGEAFRRLHLRPDDPDYNAALRERLYVASKTGQRLAFDRAGRGSTAVQDLIRSLTQLFGDGRVAIPEGAYLDSIQMHNLTSAQQVDQLYEGLDERGSGLQQRDRIGALAAMVDFRDGTNETGLNPEYRRLVRHIGITGHQSSPVLMYALQRDGLGIVDTLLVALNVNDRAYSSHQYNVLPVAAARDVGVIAMKAFADGVFYGKAPRFSSGPADVVRSVGRAGAIDPADLVRYPVSVPGVATVITGIGQIDRARPGADQLIANLAAATGDPLTPLGLAGVEQAVAQLHGAGTNYFQDRQAGLVQPSGVTVEHDAGEVVVTWHSALAGRDPILTYDVYDGSRLLRSVPFTPQTTLAPLAVTIPAAEIESGALRVVAAT